jgi:two-component system OmpR family response regulator
VRALVAEEEDTRARFLSRLLIRRGFVVDSAKTGTDALHQGCSGLYDVMLIGALLPGLTAIETCREVRRQGCTTPILVLVSPESPKHAVLALDAGADDCVQTTIDSGELRARIDALIRRASLLGRLVCGQLAFDLLHHRAWLGGRPLTLTVREYAILLLLARRPNGIVTRKEMLCNVWQTTFDSGSNIIEVHLSRLRDKLGDDSWMLETVRGSGYRLRHPEDPL